MEPQAKPVQFDEFITNAASIFHTIETEGKGVLVEHDGELFSLRKVSKPARPKTEGRNRKRSKGLTPDDSIFGIIGIGRSEEPSDIARYKDDYLADAIADHHKE